MNRARFSPLARVVCFLSLLSLGAGAALSADNVTGNLIQFYDNGAWSWYQDERAVVDTAKGKLLVGYLSNKSGVGGTPQDGDVNLTMFDLNSRRGPVQNLKQTLLSYSGGDDHNAPVFLVRPDGKYVAMYAGHNSDYYSYYRIHDGVNWGAEQRYDWRTRPGGVDTQTTYSNLFYLSAEGKTYNYARSHHKSPNAMVSSDMGTTWGYSGQLSRIASVGYVNGYYKYWSNGVDRIDFVATEYHPRDFNTSIYHGYIKGGKTYNSFGAVVDSNTFDTLNIPSPLSFSLVFAANTVVNGITMTRCWNNDIARYADSSIAILMKARANNSETDHRFFYCRSKNGPWACTYLGKAGTKLYSGEQDYTGLGALVPNDPSTIYISSTFSPIDSSSVGKHEIFKGVTADNGATWSWTQLTRNSARDNVRPIVPAWKSGSTALIWWRGTYTSAQSFDAAVVGLIDDGKGLGLRTYVDATTANTTLAAGGALAATGPDANMGAGDDQWHWRTGFGNGGSVLTSAEAAGENAPAIKTHVTVPGTGVYNVWINYWGSTGADWRVKAGLSQGEMQVYRQMAGRQVEAGEHNTTLTLTGTGNAFLYQAYLGRVTAVNNGFDVFLDDSAVAVATTTPRIANTVRAWYDGISYVLDSNAVTGVARGGVGGNPGFSHRVTGAGVEFSYTLSGAGRVDVKVYDPAGREVATLVAGSLPEGSHTVRWDARGVPAGTYFCRLAAGGVSQTRLFAITK